jgi:hypothetical protein
MERVREFSSGAICLVLASDVYYGGRLRDFDEFMDSKNETALHGSQYK